MFLEFSSTMCFRNSKSIELKSTVTSTVIMATSFWTTMFFNLPKIDWPYLWSVLILRLGVSGLFIVLLGRSIVHPVFISREHKHDSVGRFWNVVHKNMFFYCTLNLNEWPNLSLTFPWVISHVHRCPAYDSDFFAVQLHAWFRTCAHLFPFTSHFHKFGRLHRTTIPNFP